MNDQPFVVTRKVLRQLTVDTQPWLSCDDCFDLTDQYVEHLLADPDYGDRAMATHLAACSACAEETESLIALVADER